MSTAREKIIFTPYGAVGSVTGANFMLAIGARKFLVDCGMIQGCLFCENVNRHPFAYDPNAVEALFVTHSHIDHVGRIPKLVREGFSGPIYSTKETQELAGIMLEDSLGVLEKEARRSGEKPFYNGDDVARARALWRSIPAGEPFDLGGDVSVTLRNSGHILGSSMINFHYGEASVLFTGDLGNAPAPLLKEADTVTDATYLIMESVYGDRVHESVHDRKRILEDVIEDTIHTGGALLIPAFSLERTQVLLHEINGLVEQGRIPEVPVFLDSPLAIKVTDIYKRHAERFRESVRREIEGGDDIFNFPRLSFTMTTDESRAIAQVPDPKIIIAGSGMSNGGRIIHHEKRHLGDPKSTVLLAGYQAAGSLGRELQDGAKRVTILGEEIPVRARIISLGGYSAHADSEGLLEFVTHTADSVKKVFVVMGEPKASTFLAQRLRDYLGVQAIVPEEGKEYELEA